MDGGIEFQITTPGRNSITKNFAPMIVSSSHISSALGAGGNASQSRDSTRCSLAMSCAPGAIRPKGGRRSTSGSAPNRSR
jgi:hypothetical protein